MPGNVTIPQPGVPYMKMTMGGEEVTFGQDRRLMSFSYDRVVNKASRLEVQFLDTEWTYIEGLLSKNWSDGIRIEYGWLGSKDPKLWTKEPIKMTAQRFNPQIFDSYVLITITGVTPDEKIAKGNSNPQTDTTRQIGHVVLKKKSIAELVKAIFKDYGFKVDKVEETAELALAHVDTDSTLAVVPNCLITSQTPLQVFVNEWSKRAIRPGDNTDKIAKEINGYIKGENNKGQGGYFVYFIDSDPPEIVMTVEGKGEEIFATYDYPTQHKGAREVISWSYDVNIMAATTLGQHSMRVDFTDPLSGTNSSILTNADVTADGPTGKVEFKPKVSEGHVSAALRSIYPGVRNPKEQAQSIQADFWIKGNQIRRSALVLLGRPDYRIGHHIQMNVWLSRMINNKSSPERHYSSGKWQVQEVRQKITPGEFLTTLDLKKLSGYMSTPQTGGSSDKYAEKSGIFTKGEEAPSIPNNKDIDKSFWEG